MVASLRDLEHPSALHQKFELCSTMESSSKRHWVVTLGGCRLLDGLEIVIPSSTSKKIVKVPLEDCCERSCAHLIGAMKSNSSGIEVWRGSLVLAGT
jgi:hypothetical protein